MKAALYRRDDLCFAPSRRPFMPRLAELQRSDRSMEFDEFRQVTEEVMICDERSCLSPKQMIEQKLATLCQDDSFRITPDDDLVGQTTTKLSFRKPNRPR